MKTKKFLRKKLSLWLKSLLLMTGLALLTPDCIFGQAALPFSYDGGGTSLSMGLTASGLGSDYSSSPKMKFDNSSDYLILNFDEAPGALSFDIKWNRSSTTASRFPGTFTLYESDSGSTYTVVQTYNSTSGTALTNAKVVSESFITLKSTTRYIKWEYTNKEDGNIGIGNIRLDKFTPVYTIQYSINGSISIEKSYVREGSAIDNFPIIPTKSDCDGNKVFVGWIEQPISENTDVVPFFITEKYFPEGDKTLYAVFATGNIAEYDEWRAINDVSEVTEGTYVITFEHDDKRGVYFYLPSETIA
ncbi:MAG: hypothetical protein LBG15_07715, partial [Dysgonamonadaceae bacterium]|nr:hypothetical protein [Dysgonamonadaceae bacterium]